jgi:toxin ParE1/3/4
MGSRVTWTPLAVSDHNSLAEYLRCEAGLSASLRFVTATEASTLMLSQHPHIGADIGLPGHDLRRWHIDGFDNYLILYRVTDHGVEIVRVVHVTRDFNTLIGNEPS